eukprot:363694-Chlamydomonas_euryale.AAC.17
MAHPYLQPSRAWSPASARLHAIITSATYACLHVCSYACLPAYMHASAAELRMYAHLPHVCLYARIRACTLACSHAYISSCASHACPHVRRHTCMLACSHVCLPLAASIPMTSVGMPATSMRQRQPVVPSCGCGWAAENRAPNPLDVGFCCHCCCCNDSCSCCCCCCWLAAQRAVRAVPARAAHGACPLAPGRANANGASRSGALAADGHQGAPTALLALGFKFCCTARARPAGPMPRHARSCCCWRAQCGW